MSARKMTAVVTAMGISLFAGAASAETIPDRLMDDIGRDFNLQDFQAAGIVGNLARETGNFRYMQELNPTVAGSRGGIGYAQWTASRRLAFEEFAGDLENQLTYEVNYGYLKKELTEEYGAMMDEIRESKNLWESTYIFMRDFLRPAHLEANMRVSMNFANSYMAGDFEGAGCQTEHEVTINDRMIVVSTCPQLMAQVNGESVDVVMDMSLRPRARPDDLVATTDVADLVAQEDWRAVEAVVHPQDIPGPEPHETGRPDEDMRQAIAEAVALAMSEFELLPEPAPSAAPEVELASLAEDPEDEAPTDPNLLWKMIIARKEEPEEVSVRRDDDDLRLA